MNELACTISPPENPNILIMEDEDLLARALKQQLEAELYNEIGDIKVTDNIHDAETIVTAGDCNILVADLRVKRKHDSEEMVDAQKLLRVIKNNNYYVSTITHTAYSHRHEEVRREKLADIALVKDPEDNTAVIKSTVELTHRLNDLRREVFNGLSAILMAAQEDDIIEKQLYLEAGRKLLGNLSISDIPTEHRKWLRWLTSFVMRLSSVESHSLGLYNLKGDCIFSLNRMRMDFERANFKYASVRNELGTLESLGYPVLIRTDIEGI